MLFDLFTITSAIAVSQNSIIFLDASSINRNSASYSARYLNYDFDPLSYFKVGTKVIWCQKKKRNTLKNKKNKENLLFLIQCWMGFNLNIAKSACFH